MNFGLFLLNLFNITIFVFLLHSTQAQAQISAPYLSAGESYTVPRIPSTGTGGGVSDSNPSSASANSASCQLFSILRSQGGLTAPVGCSVPTSSVSKPNPSANPNPSQSQGTTSISSNGLGETTLTSSILPSQTSISSPSPIPTETSPSNNDGSDDNSSSTSNKRGPTGITSAMPAVILGFLLLAILTYFLDVLLESLA